MRYAELDDGTILALVKDCDCSGHDGPHWLFENDRWRDVAIVLLTSGNMVGFANAEYCRCASYQRKLLELGLRRTFSGTETNFSKVGSC